MLCNKQVSHQILRTSRAEKVGGIYKDQLSLLALELNFNSFPCRPFLKGLEFPASIHRVQREVHQRGDRRFD